MFYSCLRQMFILLSFLSVSALYSQLPYFIPDYEVQDTIMVTANRVEKFPQTSSLSIRMRMPLKRVPASVSIISSAMNQNQGNVVLGDALSNVSGANIQTGFGMHDYFVLRGFNTLDNGLIMTDGVSEPEVIIYNLYNVEQIEILKGPGAFIYGGKPLSGTINLVSKQPVFRNFINTSVLYGSYNSFHGTMDAGFINAKKNLSGRINCVYQQSDNYRDDKGYNVYGINPTLTWHVNKTLQLNMNLEYLKNEYKPDSGIPLVYNYQTGKLDNLADIKRTTSFQTPVDFSDQDMMRFKVTAIKKINEVSTLTSKFYFTSLDWRSAGTLINGAYPAMDGSFQVKRSLQKLDDQQKLMGNQTEWLTRIETGPVQHNLLFGVEASQLSDNFEIDIAPQIPELNLNDPVETYAKSLYPAYPYQHRKATIRVLAPYFLDVVTMSPKVNFILGCRYDWISFEEENIDVNESYKSMSPMIGINYLPMQNMSLYANAGQAFAPPSSRSDGKLEPEKSSQIELGMKNIWLNNKIYSTLSIYQIDKNDIAIPDKNGFMQQVGSQRSNGVEFEVQAQMSERCASIFSYAYTNAEMTEFAESVIIGVDNMGIPVSATVDRSGNQASFAPRHILNFWHTRDISSTIGFGAGVRYVSKQYIAEDNVYEIDGFTTFNATIFYKTDMMRWYLNFKNIFNTRYEMRGFGGYSVIPALPFSVYSKIEIAL